MPFLSIAAQRGGGRSYSAAKAALVSATLDGRQGRPEDVAEAVRYLASPGAAHVTAQILAVNGGAVPGR